MGKDVKWVTEEGKTTKTDRVYSSELPKAGPSGRSDAPGVVGENSSGPRLALLGCGTEGRSAGTRESGKETSSWVETSA